MKLITKRTDLPPPVEKKANTGVYLKNKEQYWHIYYKAV